MTETLRAHFVNYTVAYSRTAPAVKTSTATANVDKYASASYVSAEDTQSCRVCHNPHDNSSVLKVNRDWAQSGHADTEALPFVKYRFKEVVIAGTSECRRCHTSTGFVYYVSNNKTLIPNSELKSGKQNEVLGCRTCRVDYSWKRRALAAVTVTYSNSAGTSTETVSYPDSGESNICLNCHTGRESGNIIKNLPASTDFAVGRGFENSHYLTAGAPSSPRPATRISPESKGAANGTTHWLTPMVTALPISNMISSAEGRPVPGWARGRASCAT